MNELIVKALLFGMINSSQVCVPTELASAASDMSSARVQQIISQNIVSSKDADQYPVEESINDKSLSSDNSLAQGSTGENPISTEQAKQPAEPAPQVPLSETGYQLVEKYSTSLPSGMFLHLKYDQHLPAYDYVLLHKTSGNVRGEPTTESAVVKNASYFEKLNLIEAVRGQYVSSYGTDVWYRVFWYSNGEMRFGYILSPICERRSFQFDKMKSSMDTLKSAVSGGRTGYISNYKNKAGSAPLYKGSSADSYGNLRDQSAPAYFSLQSKSEFLYLGDGELFSITGESGSYYSVKSPRYSQTLWVPKKYVYTKNAPSSLSQVVVVDRKNQNEAVFEWTDMGWQMISYSFATTGANAKYKFETPLGYFMAIERKSQFLYLDDVTKQISGYAPYAIRFTGGAYIHGVPVDYVKKNGKLVDPGQKESIYTLGTYPRSHKCVRNFTSHAKFLYDWVDIGRAGIIVIE